MGRTPSIHCAPVAPVLAELLGVAVAFAEDCVGEAAKSAAAALPEGGVLLLENTRFHPTEEKNDLDLAKQLAELGDVYVNDALAQLTAPTHLPKAWRAICPPSAVS